MLTFSYYAPTQFALSDSAWLTLALSLFGSFSHILAHSDSVWLTLDLSQALSDTIGSLGPCSAFHFVDVWPQFIPTWHDDQPDSMRIYVVVLIIFSYKCASVASRQARSWWIHPRKNFLVLLVQWSKSSTNIWRRQSNKTLMTNFENAPNGLPKVFFIWSKKT